MRGPLVEALRGRYLGTSSGLVPTAAAIVVRRTLGSDQGVLTKARVLRPSPDDILDAEQRLSERFRGSDALIHLAGLPHPRVRGATESDFRALNYDGSVNIFRAAKTAGVQRFVFASSAQVYGINRPVRIEQFPILETNHCPTPAEGQSLYGWLKRDVERRLEAECDGRTIQAVSLRLEFPGVRSRYPWNFYISTSVENLVAGFVAAIEAEIPGGSDVFNLADSHVDPGIVDIQEFARSHWPRVPNFTAGNESLLSTERARSVLGYRPRADGTYFSRHVMW